MTDSPHETLRAAEARLFAKHGLPRNCRKLKLRDPALEVAVREVGDGPPLLLVHGSGMSAGTWAPMMEHLPDRRLIAVDLPGFGLSDPHSYEGRSLRAHATAQLTSVLDALELDRTSIVGTSLGAMWTLSLALEAPDRVQNVYALGVPAVSLPGMKGDPFFTLMTTPVVRRAVVRMPPPSTAPRARKGMRKVLGKKASETTGDEFYEVVAATMAMPAWSNAMYTHLNLALRRGRARPENIFSDDELRRIKAPTRFIWGAQDVYGPPAIGERAARLMPDASVHVIPGGHAPFLDDPEACARIVRTEP